jgi:hypothetical protein
MNARMVHFAALTGALLLALPAGWCGQIASAGHDTTQTTCCEPVGGAPVDSRDVPGLPAAQCCCSQPVIATEKVVCQADVRQAGDVDYASAVVTSDSIAASDALSLCEPTSLRLSAGSRLHALLCVWRC